MKMDSYSKKNRKKIIFFTETKGTGGAEEYLKRLVLCLKDEFDVRIAIPKNKGTELFVTDLISKQIKIDYIKKYNFLSNYFYFRRNKPDYIHFNLPFPDKCMTAILVGIIYSKSKIYVTEHTAPPYYKPYLFIKLIKKFLYAKLDRGITVSNKNRDVLMKNFNLPGNKIKVIYNSVDIDYIKNYNHEMVLELKNKFSINDSSLIFGIVGRLDIVKGHKYLIEASKNVIDKVPHSLFLFVGDGNQKNQLVRDIKNNNIKDYFRLLGYQKNIPEVLALIDIFVLPSLSEGLPFSILEAMAARKPVIATYVGGIPEIITNNVNGILVKPKDPDALAKAMTMLAKDAKKRDEIAETAYKKLMESFSLEKMVAATKEVYGL